MKLGWVAGCLVVYTAYVIRRVIPQMPERIPTSFDWQGRPTASSSPDALWGMLVAQALGTILILAIPYVARRAPQMVNLGWRKLSDFPPAYRQQVMPLIEDMSGWMAVTFALFLTLLVRALIRAALDPGTSPSMWPVALFIAATVGIVVYYLYRVEQIWKREVVPNLRPRAPSARHP